MFASYDEWLAGIKEEYKGKNKEILTPCCYCDGKGKVRCDCCKTVGECRECDGKGYNWRPFTERTLELYTPAMYCTAILHTFTWLTPGQWNLLPADFWTFVKEENDDRRQVDQERRRRGMVLCGQWAQFTEQTPRIREAE